MKLMIRVSTRVMACAIGVVVLASACGDSDAPQVAGTAPTSTAAPEQPAATEPAPTTSPTTEPPPPTTAAQTPDLAASVSEGWTATFVGEGIKPALALDETGQPAIAYMLEDFDGFIALARQSDGWAMDTVVEGYFYGPIDLAFDAAGSPYIAYHDHQAPTFELELGDLMIAQRSGETWMLETLTHPGHDGWDSTIVIGADGVVRAAGIDPAQFGSSDGVEYYERGESGWEITGVGSGPVEYQFNVALAVTPDGRPALSWFDMTNADLVYAERTDTGWQLETVADEGSIGMFSSLAFDGDGAPHLSFYSDTSGEVLYATRQAGSWATEAVASLDDVQLGQLGARRITAIGLGANGEVLIAYTDQARLALATRDAAGTWAEQDVVAAGALPLGQQVALRIADDGAVHLATYEVTEANPLNGRIIHLTD